MLLDAIRGRIIFGLAPERVNKLEGTAGVALVGHRGYVGGRWAERGKAQFDFMVGLGLRPEHVFLDIACGALRGGVHFIPYLEPGHYLGIERERSLVRSGLYKELPAEVREQKRPELVVSGSFEFDRFSKQPDFSLAHSLFTHLTARDIDRCLANLRAFVAPGHELYATFSDGPGYHNRARSHARALFKHPAQELEAAGARNGWACDYLGDSRVGNAKLMQFIAR